MTNEDNLVLGLPEKQAREIYIKQIEEWTNTLFDRNNLPGGVEVALVKLMAIDPQNLMVASEKLSDMSLTYHSMDDAYKMIKSNLEPYTRPHLVGNKKKRKYLDGR